MSLTIKLTQPGEATDDFRAWVRGKKDLSQIASEWLLNMTTGLERSCLRHLGKSFSVSHLTDPEV